MKRHVPSRTTALLLPLLAGAIEVKAQCHYIPSTVQFNDTVTYALAGGSFASYGCAPVDPTFWLSGNAAAIGAFFSSPQAHPIIRVWGMNDDDVAFVQVNGAAYYMDNASATLYPKVVCGQSPGPDGVVFSNGNVVGANDGVEGNYSYQDIMLNIDNVSSVTVSSLAGAGWGFAGVVLDCASAMPEQGADAFGPYPNPTQGLLTIGDGSKYTDATVLDAVGARVLHVAGHQKQVDLTSLAPGHYLVVLVSNGQRSVYHVVRT